MSLSTFDHQKKTLKFCACGSAPHTRFTHYLWNSVENNLFRLGETTYFKHRLRFGRACAKHDEWHLLWWSNQKTFSDLCKLGMDFESSEEAHGRKLWGSSWESALRGISFEIQWISLQNLNILTHWAYFKKFFKSFFDQDFNREFGHTLCFGWFFDSVWRSKTSLF